MSVSFWFSLVYWILTVLDIITTEIGLRTGAVELNGFYLTWAGKALKPLSVLVVYLCLIQLENRGHFKVLLGVGFFVVFYYIIVVVNNVMVICGG